MSGERSGLGAGLATIAAVFAIGAVILIVGSGPHEGQRGKGLSIPTAQANVLVVPQQPSWPSPGGAAAAPGGQTPTATAGGTATPPTPTPAAGPQAGLLLGFRQVQGDGSVAADARVSRLLAFAVPAGEAPTPFLQPGRFRATLEGSVVLDLWDELTFTVEGTGSVKLTIRGTEVIADNTPLDKGPVSTKSIRLEKGANPILLSYQAPEKGDARLRVLWSSKDFQNEPVPPRVLVHQQTSAAHDAAAQRRARERIAELRCTSCHASDAAKTGAMPDLQQDAPDLKDAGKRLNASWIAHWVQSPRTIRPNARMPHVLPGSEAEQRQQALDIAAYLSGGAADAAAAKAEDAQIGKGAHRFVRLGCAGCHGAGDHAGVVPLDTVAQKFKGDALVAFLKQPAAHYRWIRMPDFKLSDEEATELAAYLRSRPQRALPALSGSGDAARGKALVTKLGCANCHQGLDAPQRSGLPALAALAGKSGGCLADAPSAGVPDYGLAAADRAALAGFLAKKQDALTRESAAEFADRRMRTLNCRACHANDNDDSLLGEHEAAIAKLIEGVPDTGDAEFADQTNIAMEQPKPFLTWAGEKLQPGWVAAFVAGGYKERPRPWLHMRMPAFAQGADLLARGLALQHGMPPTDDAPLAAQDKQAVGVGTRLIGNEGFDCLACHGVGSTEPHAVFEAPGINLTLARGRLRPAYYERWMWSPPRVDPNTKMPQFTGAGGLTAYTDVYDGSARKQYRAIWDYLGTVAHPGDGATLPKKK